MSSVCLVCKEGVPLGFIHSGILHSIPGPFIGAAQHTRYYPRQKEVKVKDSTTEKDLLRMELHFHGLLVQQAASLGRVSASCLLWKMAEPLTPDTAIRRETQEQPVCMTTAHLAKDPVCGNGQ